MVSASRIDVCLWMLSVDGLSKVGGRAVSEAGWADVDTLKRLLLGPLDQAALAPQLDLEASVVDSAADLVDVVASEVVGLAKPASDHKVEAVLVIKEAVVGLVVVAMVASLTGWVVANLLPTLRLVQEVADLAETVVGLGLVGMAAQVLMEIVADIHL